MMRGKKRDRYNSNVQGYSREKDGYSNAPKVSKISQNSWILDEADKHKCKLVRIKTADKIINLSHRKIYLC